MVVKVRVPFLVLSIVRHLLFRLYPKRDPNFDNHPYGLDSLNPQVPKVGSSLSELRQGRFGKLDTGFEHVLPA